MSMSRETIGNFLEDIGRAVSSGNARAAAHAWEIRALTRPEIEEIEDLDARISSVDVRWPGYDAAGAERSSERSRYLIRLDDRGRPRIRVAIGLPPDA